MHMQVIHYAEGKRSPCLCIVILKLLVTVITTPTHAAAVTREMERFAACGVQGLCM